MIVTDLQFFSILSDSCAQNYENGKLREVDVRNLKEFKFFYESKRWMEQCEAKRRRRK